MKSFSTLILLLLLVNLQLIAQIEDKCFPKKMMVAADDLLFRSEPNTDSKPIDKLTNAEYLTVLGYHTDGYNNFPWIKVKRDLTGEVGFVYGRYVKNPEMAYLNRHDTDRLQTGNWYGIFQDQNGKTQIEKTNPTIEVEEDEGFSIIRSKQKHKIIICSQEEIKEGVIKGKLFLGETEYLKIGGQKRLGETKGYEYRLVCTGEVNFDQAWMTRENEKVIFAKIHRRGDYRHNTQQDLSDCLGQFGEVGYIVHFAGDLNGDGIPELIISEGTNQGVTVYYFRSKNGKLELQSLTGVISRC